MALTSNSDLYGRFHEKAFNKIITEIMLQRPATFNYATERVVKFKSLCVPIPMNPILEAKNIPKVTIVPPMPVIGLNTAGEGIDFCLQLKEFAIDFNPTNTIQLPPELGNLGLQEFSLKGGMCAGINCGGMVKNISPNAANEMTNMAKFKGMAFSVSERLSMICFCLNLYAKVVMVNDGNFIRLRLSGLEIQDITPPGLENAMECYLKQVMDQVVFPKIKIAIEDLVFNAGEYFVIGLTPISGSVPNNPEIANDSVSIYLNIN